ncbi:MAG: hypothetical protein Q8O05_05345 [Chloroflexota bacterium]|nr:hypothetical protein [Chloroflexota bacterium]
MAEDRQQIARPFPRMTVGVMGSSGGNIPAEVSRKVYALGREIGRRRYVLITGACPGLPHEAVKGAKSLGGIVVGVSPALNFEEHVTKFESPVRGYDALIYTGSGLMGREIENIRSCDVVVFAGGRSGTLGEFAIAYDEGKIIGILESTGGITEHLNTIVSFVNKDTGAILVSDPDPAGLLDRMEQLYQSRLLPKYESLMANRNPDGILPS